MNWFEEILSGCYEEILSGCSYLRHCRPWTAGEPVSFVSLFTQVKRNVLVVFCRISNCVTEILSVCPFDEGIKGVFQCLTEKYDSISQQCQPPKEIMDCSTVVVSTCGAEQSIPSAVACFYENFDLIKNSCIYPSEVFLSFFCVGHYFTTLIYFFAGQVDDGSSW